jgi:hypothetical protein
MAHGAGMVNLQFTGPHGAFLEICGRHYMAGPMKVMPGSAGNFHMLIDRWVQRQGWEGGSTKASAVVSAWPLATWCCQRRVVPQSWLMLGKHGRLSGAVLWYRLPGSARRLTFPTRSARVTPIRSRTLPLTAFYTRSPQSCAAQTSIAPSSKPNCTHLTDRDTTRWTCLCWRQRCERWWQRCPHSRGCSHCCPRAGGRRLGCLPRPLSFVSSRRYLYAHVSCFF